MFKKIEKQKTIILGIAVISIILLIIKILDNNYQKEENIQINTNLLGKNNDEEIEEKIVVYITGEVNNEGVIELKYGSRIADAIEKAGGLTENANIKNVNLAYEIEDGQKIYIPNVSEEEAMIVDDFGGIEETESKKELININKANMEQLQSLNGIGESLAQSILQYREDNGKFNSIEDLMNVPGIGESKFNTIKSYIKVK